MDRMNRTERRKRVDEKTGRGFARGELADYLEDLAGQFRDGRLERDGAHWTIPERIEAKIGFKEKKGRLVTKLTLS